MLFYARCEALNFHVKRWLLVTKLVNGASAASDKSEKATPIPGRAPT